MLALVARGLNDTEVAEALGLSPLTAKGGGEGRTPTGSWAGSDARDRARLVIAPHESGLVAPGGTAGSGG